MADESFMKSLFGGVVAEGLIFPYPETKRSEADELHVVLEGLRRFASKSVDSARIDREATLSPDLLAGLGELGLSGLVVPKAHGGAGLYCPPWAAATAGG